MGMDVYGNKPSAEEGKYFRASIWTWPPIHEACAHVNRSMGLGLSTEGWQYNDGAGLATQDKCNRLAAALESFMESDWPKGQEQMEIEHSGGMEMLVLDHFEKAGIKRVDPARPCYSVAREKFVEFIAFLRACGGFKIR